MEQTKYENAVDVLSTLVTALGAGVAVWGTVNMLEGYQREADFEQLAGEYRSRIAEIDGLVCGLIEDKATGRITAAQYQAGCAEYDAEMDECFEAIADLKAGIAAQKRQGLEQILTGGRLALIAPFVGSPEDIQFALDYTDRKHRENGKMPV